MTTIILHTYGTTGDAREFEREAKAYDAWSRARGRATRRIAFLPRPQWSANRAASEAAIVACGKALVIPDRVAIFCHGLRGKVQLGWDRSTARSLAQILRDANAIDATSIALYACSTSGSEWEDGEGSFADALRDAMADLGFRGGRVFAHNTAGHATRNRSIRILEIGTPHELGERYAAYPVVKPTEHDLWDRLGGFLSDTTDGRWLAAEMSAAELREAAAKSEPKREK